ncbi:MAG: undecaprenyl-diphosphatase UppP [Candidatus Magasanikbacteria bacterium CG10_big_fil_rev_8_21_14_0_10_47_10]|uniref:Undecaprenyl-diphosphatase n=1 Tax=Candidatus Magasanikbacteria bacterium CG10_big_fil_rev_8_21_14_0_10_47_10 TaxID=1974652 RepID=A0A2H0TQB5_9BACT|nr:MAG: undecaprenyl-diphosphatase UppP [Candidatus Magasanikbacteria bacterium CG10_big_fil_rev_8_21_14_0_10_47_10]
MCCQTLIFRQFLLKSEYMTFTHAIILGAVQGVTEFLPVSSSGHLIFIPKLFGWQDQGLAFDVIVHMGTLFAVCVYFRKKLRSILYALISRETGGAYSRKLGYFLAASIVPAALVGFLLSEVAGVEIRSAKVVAASLIVWAFVLGIAESWQKKRAASQKDTNHLTWRDVLVIAFAQVISLIPGTSRSGITMTAGLFRNLGPQAAAEFSFLMSIPVIAAAGFLKIVQIIKNGMPDIGWSPLFVGFVASGISGFFAISWLMNLVKKNGFMPFVVYRIIIGLIIVVLIV